MQRNFIFRCSTRSKCKLLSPSLAPHRYFRFAQRDALCTCIRDSSRRYGFTVTSRRNEGAFRRARCRSSLAFLSLNFSRASTLPNIQPSIPSCSSGSSLHFSNAPYIEVRMEDTPLMNLTQIFKWRKLTNLQSCFKDKIKDNLIRRLNDLRTIKTDDNF